MRKEPLMSKWPQLRGEIKSKWGLTDDELDQINGDYQVLADKIQQKSGRTREQINREVEALLVGKPAPKREPAPKKPEKPELPEPVSKPR